MAEVDVNIEGLDEVLRKMGVLKDKRKIRNAAMRAGRKAMNIVRDAARNNAKAIDDPATYEKIWKNIAVQAGKNRNPDQALMRVGVKGEHLIAVQLRRSQVEATRDTGVSLSMELQKCLQLRLCDLR